MTDELPEKNYGLMFQKWEIGHLGTNQFKISLPEGDMDLEYIQFDIKNEGDETSLIMHHLYVEELIKNLSFYLTLINQHKKGMK